MAAIIAALAILVVTMYVLRFHAYMLNEPRFRFTIVQLGSLMIAYVLIQPAIAHVVDRLTPGIAGALWLSNLGSMTAAACAVQFFILLYHGFPARGGWIPLLLLGCCLGTTVTLALAGPQVTLAGSLPATASAWREIALVADRLIYSSFQAVMIIMLAQVIWYQRQLTRDRVGHVSFVLFLAGCGCAAPYLLTAILLGLPHPSPSVLGWNTMALNVMIACFFIGALLPVITMSPAHFLHNSRLMVVAIRLYPLWSDMTHRVAGVKYTAIAWQSCWRDPTQTALLVRRYTIESYNAAQVLIDDWSLARVPYPFPLTIHTCARADAASYAVFAATDTPDCAMQTLLKGFPYSDHRHPAQAIQYLELVAHYYVTREPPARRYRWWMLLEWLLGKRCLYRPLPQRSLEIA